MELEVLKKARELGELLQNSDTFKELMEAQAEMEADEECLDIIQQLNEMEHEIETMMQTMDPESAEVKLKAASYKALRQKVEDNLKMIRYQGAAQSFQQMMTQVNQIIQFFLTGDSGCDSCGGDCGSCGGCH